MGGWTAGRLGEAFLKPNRFCLFGLMKLIWIICPPFNLSFFWGGIGTSLMIVLYEFWAILSYVIFTPPPMLQLRRGMKRRKSYKKLFNRTEINIKIFQFISIKCWMYWKCFFPRNFQFNKFIRHCTSGFAPSSNCC